MSRMMCRVIFVMTMFCCISHKANSQSFALGGGTTFRHQLHFFNVEGGIWNVARTRWNVHAGLKTRLVASGEAGAGEKMPAEARYTPYARVGYTVIPKSRRLFAEVSLTAEQSPELGFAAYFRVSRQANLNIALIPRLTLGRNDYTLGTYCMIVMGI